MRIRTAIAAAAVALVSVGCSTAAPAQDELTSPAPTASASAAAATTADAEPKEATVQQVASAVARHEPELREVLTDVETQCDFLLQEEPCRGVGAIRLFTLGIQAKTLAVDLEALDDEQAGQYVGSIPTELSGLVDSTVAAAQALGDIDTDGDPLEMNRLVRNIVRELDAWSPYL